MRSVKYRFFFDDRRKLLEELRQAGRISAHSFELSWLSLCEEDFDSYETLTQYWEDESPAARSRIQVARAFVDAGRGKWKAARERLRAAEAIDRSWPLAAQAWLLSEPSFPLDRSELIRLQRWLLAWRNDDRPVALRARTAAFHEHLRILLLGLVEARLGDRQATSRRAASLKALPPLPATTGSFVDDYRRVLEALAEDEPREALQRMAEARFERVHPSLGTSPFSFGPQPEFILAELLKQNRQFREAAGWYEAILVGVERPPVGFTYVGVARLHLAECYEQLGRNDEAARQYAMFINLWKECDPELQRLVDGARARLAALKGT